ncbi:hypothetical protein Salat_1157100 [Sesamum alatum]|uniref:Uncharacterized protein n=1 Tax=Sesamum alatum TaxID=300844 RepID=A0AAE1YEH3_9LAMI|nr:hypothetical protein Salat_1157100 [Sesamum alatum]
MANDEPSLDDIVNGDGSAVVSFPSSEEVVALNRLLSEFNLSKFLALANRVIDEGNLGSMEAISDLKRRWTENLVLFSPIRRWLHVFSSRTLAPFRPITTPTRPARRIPRMPTTKQMNAYLQHTPSVAASFPIPLLSLPPSSMASSSLFPVSAAVETLAPPSIVAILEGSEQDPDNQPPSLHVEPPSSNLIRLPYAWIISCKHPYMLSHLPSYLIRLPYVWIISRNLPYLAWIHILRETCTIYRWLLPLHGRHLQHLWTKETHRNHRKYSLVMFP